MICQNPAHLLKILCAHNFNEKLLKVFIILFILPNNN